MRLQGKLFDPVWSCSRSPFLSCGVGYARLDCILSNKLELGYMTERTTGYIHLSVLFLVALTMRLGYLWLAVRHLTLEGFWRYAQDTGLYLLVAQHLQSSQPLGEYGLLRIGPGYALILAAIQSVFGQNPYYPILFSVLMGCLAPVLVYLLAWYLTENRSVAFISGFFAAVSLTSVALSCHILTDQPFFTFHAAALVCFVLGFRTGKVKWFVIAGIIAGYAAYIRPVGQMWPYLFFLIPLLLPRQEMFSSRTDMLKRAGVTAAVMLIMVLGWSARNYIVHDQFTFGTNGALTVRSCLVAQVTADRTRETNIVGYRDIWEEEDGDRDLERFEGAAARAKVRVIEALEEYPGPMFRAYFRNIEDNIKAANYYAQRQVPELAGFMGWLNAAVRNWLAWLIVVVTVVGVGFLWKDRNYLAAGLLGLTYFYFTMILGASFWQGSRLHYPAEMAWAILATYAGYRLWGIVGRLVHRRVKSAQT